MSQVRFEGRQESSFFLQLFAFGGFRLFGRLAFRIQRRWLKAFLLLNLAFGR
jgi:hypothetical protein